MIKLVNKDVVFRFETRLIRTTGLILAAGIIFNPFFSDFFINFKELLICVLIGGAVMFSLFDKSVKYQSLNLFDLLVLFYLLIYSIDEVFRGYGQFVSIIRAIFYVNLIFVYMYIKLIFSDMKCAKQYFNTLLFFTLVNCSIGYLQYFKLIESNNGYFAITGFLFNPGPYIIYTGTLFCMMIPFVSMKGFMNDSAEKIIYIISGLFFFLMVILCDSRSSWIALFLVILGNFLVIKHKMILLSLRNKYCFFLLLSLFLVVICYSFYHLIQYKGGSSLGRILIWESCKEIIKNNFLIGVGHEMFYWNLNNAQYLYFKSYPTSPYISAAGNVKFAFNDMLQTLCEYGIIGFISIISIIVFAFRTAWYQIYQKYNTLLWSSISGISFILISGLFAYPLQVLEIKILFIFLLGVLSSQFINKKQNTMERQGVKVAFKQIKYLKFVFLFMLVFLSFFRMSAFVEFKKLSQSDLFETASSLYRLERLKTFINDDPSYGLYLSKVYLDKNRPLLAIRVLENLVQLSPEIICYYNLIEMYKSEKVDFKYLESLNYLENCYPNLVYPKYLLALYYYDSNNTIGWMAYSNSVLCFKPKINNLEVHSMKLKIKEMLSRKSN